MERENPIAVADRYLAHLARPSVTTLAQVADHFDVSTAKVSYHLALVRRLPEDFVCWLREVDDPAVLRVLTERRLRPITRITDQLAQHRAITELIDSTEADSAAS